MRLSGGSGGIVAFVVVFCVVWFDLGGGVLRLAFQEVFG